MPDGGNQRNQVAIFSPPRIAYHPAVLDRFGVDQAGWRALIDAVWPAAKTADAVCLALSYCKARKLDPFKRPVHIVPVWSEEERRMVEGVWPGIGELRTTAFRTGLYAGREPTQFGPDKELDLDGLKITVPEWAQTTVYRLAPGAGPRPYPGPRVYWLEAYATAKRDTVQPNRMWRKRPYGQLDKCSEAAALRAAFPEEIGGEAAAEEMEGQAIEHAPAPSRPRRQDYVEASAPTEAGAEPVGDSTFVVVDFVGEASEYATAEEAQEALLKLIGKARTAKALEAVRESNLEVFTQIADAIEDGAEILHKAISDAEDKFAEVQQSASTETSNEREAAAAQHHARQTNAAPPQQDGSLESLAFNVENYKASNGRTSWKRLAEDMQNKIDTLTTLKDALPYPEGRFAVANREILDNMRSGDRSAWADVSYSLGNRELQLRSGKQASA